MPNKFKNLSHDFPILKRKINDEPLVYLDNAATSQTPNQVLNRLVIFINTRMPMSIVAFTPWLTRQLPTNRYGIKLHLLMHRVLNQL